MLYALHLHAVILFYISHRCWNDTKGSGAGHRTSSILASPHGGDELRLCPPAHMRGHLSSRRFKQWQHAFKRPHKRLMSCGFSSCRSFRDLGTAFRIGEENKSSSTLEGFRDLRTLTHKAQSVSYNTLFGYMRSAPDFNVA